MTANYRAPSLILQSSHIFLITLTGIRESDWQAHQDYGFQRVLGLQGKLGEVLKGKVAEKTGALLSAEVCQYENRSLFNLPTQGVWSHLKLAAGSSLLVFADSPEASAATMLCDPACKRVVARENFLAATRLALQFEAEQPLIEEMLSHPSLMSHAENGLFAEYLAAKLSGDTLFEAGAFETIMTFLEHPGLPILARTLLFNAIRTTINTSPNATIQDHQRLAMAMLRLLDIPQAQALHENLANVILPNAVGLAGKGIRIAAKDVFKGNPEELESLKKRFAGRNRDASANTLRDWLNAK